jgi:YHS domain-containing protein
VKEFKPAEPKKEEKKAEAPKAINAKCPVSGKDVDPAVTFLHQGQAIGFCCKDCCKQFAAEPAKFIEKVKEFKPAKKDEKKADAPKKAINAKCPLAGKDVDPAAVFVYKDQAIGFCCMNCCKKFAADPEKYIAKVTEFKK